MTNYWVFDSWVDNGPGKGRYSTYKTVDALPPGKKIGRYTDDAFYAVEPYHVHGKPYGLKDDRKPVLLTVYGVGGEDLLVAYAEPDKVALYDHFDATAWTTVRFDQTTEGWRFVRSVVKAMKVLTSLAKKAAVENRKNERNRTAAKAREGREGTCQICEGRQIIQPTGENKGTLVLHGYNRPGYGYTVGECFGYHRKPFEVACDALEEFVTGLKATLASEEGRLATLPTLTSMLVEKSWRDKTLVTITPKDARWNSTMASKTYEVEANIRSLKRDIAYQTARLEGWYDAHKKVGAA